MFRRVHRWAILSDIKTTSKHTKSDTENGCDGRGPGCANGKKVRVMREEDGLLDITGNDPGEEVSVGDTGPEDGGNGDEKEGANEDLEDIFNGLRETVEFDDARGSCHL